MSFFRLRRLHLPGIGGLLRGLVIVGLLLATQPGTPLARAQNDEFVRLSNQLSTYMGELEAVRAEIDRNRFDLESLAFELAFEDAETITAYVRNAIAFEAYPGLLRGPSGTLIDGAGNALDQAVLLASLLGSAGYEAVVRRGTLPRPLAEQLLMQLAPRQPEALAQAARTPFDFTAEQLAEVEAEAERQRAALHAEAAAAAALIEAQLEPGAGAGLLEAVVTEAQDYFWVEYRLSGNDPWTAAHPAFAEPPAALAELVATETLDGEVPAALQHRFRVQAFIERKLGDQLEVSPIMAAWERPAANLTGEVLTFTSFADGFPAVEDPGDLEAVLAATNFFFPIFENDLAPGGQAFDLAGNVLPPEAAADAMAGIFQTVGESLGGAAGMLGNLGSSSPTAPDETIALTAQWLEFTLIAPDGSESVHRRYLFDRVGQANREAGVAAIGVDLSDAEVLDALLTAQTIMLAPGRYSAPYVTDRGIEMVLAARPFLEGTLEALFRDAEPLAFPVELAEANAALTPLNLYALFDDAPLGEGVVSYRPAPALLVLSQRLDRSHAQVDIVANPRRSFVAGAGALPTPDPASTLLAGVWETRAEALPLQRSDFAVFSTFAAFDAVAAAGVEFVTLAAGDLAALERLELPAAARAAIAEDLSRGYAVIAPERLPAEMTMAAWWRIDPQTGETLGRGRDGRGNAFVEFLTTFEVSVTITAAFAVGGAAMCNDLPPREAGCCIVQNVVMAGIGTGIGVLLAAAYTTTVASLVIFGVMDIGYNVGGLFLPTFCPG